MQQVITVLTTAAMNGSVLQPGIRLVSLRKGFELGANGCVPVDVTEGGARASRMLGRSLLLRGL